MTDAARQPLSSLAALWLVLATIFVHALLPVGSPIERMSGSAFSAATSDVSLARGHAVALADEGTPGDLDGGDPPSWPALPVATSAAAQAIAPQAGAPQAVPADRLPSPAGVSPYAPRAPPLS